MLDLICSSIVRLGNVLKVNAVLPSFSPALSASPSLLSPIAKNQCLNLGMVR